MNRDRTPSARTILAITCAAAACLAMPAGAATQCVPAGNPGSCDAFHASIQDAINAAAPGDTVLVGPGIWNESPNVTKSLTLTSNDGRDFTTINLQRMTNYVHSLQIAGGTDVVVDGFTIVGLDADCALPAGQNLAASNIYLLPGVGTVVVRNNRLQVGFTTTAAGGGCTNGDDGIGILTTYSPGMPAGTLSVENNVIEPLTAAGGRRAFYVNPGLTNFRLAQNLIRGLFHATAITQAATGIVVENQVDGMGLNGAGLGTWGNPDANVWGHTTFSFNVFTGVLRGLGLFESNDVLLECNLFQENDSGVSIIDGFGTPNFDPTLTTMRYNRFKNNAIAGAENAATTPGTVNGEDNFWNAANGPSGAGPGSGDAVLGDIDFDPFLTMSPKTFCDPLAVKLDSLRAEWTPDGVAIRWTTLQEESSAGFRVLRAVGARKVDVMQTLTDRPIPPRGSTIGGADYTFVDTNAPAGDRLVYYLEEIDVRGEVTRYGPVSPTRVAPQGARGEGRRTRR